MTEGRANLQEVLDLALRAAAAGLRVAVPARVVSVDHAACRVRVRPQVRLPRVDPDLPAEALPELLDVPVLFYGGAGAEVRFALAEGDPGLVLFGDAAHGGYLQTGAVSDPVLSGWHGLAGAAFLPAGPYPEGEQPEIPASGVVVGVRGGEALEVVGDEVRAGRGAAEALALLSELNALITAYNAHTHLDPVSGSTGVPSDLATPGTGTQVTKGK